MNLYFRADGNCSIGMGHLYRSFALAQMLKQEFEIIFVCKKAPEHFLQTLISLRFKYIIVSSEEDWIGILTNRDIVVLDGYEFDLKMQVQIKKRISKLALIDDIHSSKLEVDLLINHAPGISKSDYADSKISEFAIGIEYALLRPSFLLKAQSNRVLRTINEVLISFGGADTYNLSYTLASYLLEKSSFQLHVVLGLNQENNQLFNDLILKYKNRLRISFGIGEKDMLDAMLSADLGIVPTSSILFECIASKLPVISGYFIDNQKMIYKGLKDLNCFFDAGNFSSNQWKEMLTNIQELDCQALIQNQGKVIDGFSNQRLIEKFKQLSK